MQDIAVTLVNSMQADGCTNLSGGLFEGVEQVNNKTPESNPVKSIMLLTDGHANKGITSPYVFLTPNHLFLALKL